MSLRRMRNNVTFTALNIGGFSIGFAVCIVLALFVYKENTVDTDFANYQNIYRLVDVKNNTSNMDYDISGQLKEQFSEVQDATPFNYIRSDNPIFLKKAKSHDNVQIGEIISTTNAFFEMFSVGIISSKTTNPFADENSIILTKSLAQKLFGSTDVVDELVNINGMFELPVCAVVEDLPENSSFNADVYLNAENDQFRFSQYCNGTMCYNPVNQYVYLNENVDLVQLTDKLNAGFPPNKSGTDSIQFQPLANIYLSADSGIEGNRNKAGSRGLLMIFLSIAGIILLMTAINYINFTLSNLLSTLKELGIKITTGASRRSLRSFYITEITVSVVLSFVIAIIISLVSLPYAENLLTTTLKMKWLLTIPLLTVFSLILFFIILISSSVPLMIVSKYSVQKLFGKQNIRFGKQRGKKILTTFQIAASIVLLISLVSIQRQLSYVKNTDLGFEKERLICLNIPHDFKSYDVLKQRYKDLPFVKGASLSEGGPGFVHIGMGDGMSSGGGFQLDCIYIDEDFLSVFDIPLLEGMSFLGSDKGRSCYFNKTALEKYGWNDIEGKKFNNGRKGGFDVVGVVGDFHVKSLHSSITPVCLMYAENYTSINLKLLPGNLGEQMNQLRVTWDELFPDVTFNYQFYDEYFDSLYKKEDRQGKAIAVFSVIALIITCLGLLGQISQTCIARIKEIGIRKVNGAKTSEVVILLNKDFVIWVIVAFVFAAPLAYYVMNKWLESFAYKITLDWWIFALAGTTTLGIAMLTVSWLSWKTASRNPVEALRYE